MLWKMCITIALSLTFIAAASEGFFIPSTIRKQGPNTSGFGGQQWISSPVSPNPSSSGGNNNVQPNYSSVKHYAHYQQQPQQFQQQQIQPHQQQQQSQQIYSTQSQSSQLTGLKYEPVPYHTLGQPQYGYENNYGTSYPPTVQLVPCLCPVNKDIIEQQNQSLQQQISAIPSSSETNTSATAQPLQATQKKTS